MRTAASSVSATSSRHFDAEMILEIVGVVVNMNVWTWHKLAEGAKPG